MKSKSNVKYKIPWPDLLSLLSKKKFSYYLYIYTRKNLLFVLLLDEFPNISIIESFRSIFVPNVFAHS